MKRFFPLFLMCFLALGLVVSGQSLFAESVGSSTKSRMPRHPNPNRPQTTTGATKKTPKRINRRPGRRKNGLTSVGAGKGRKSGAGKKGRRSGAGKKGRRPGAGKKGRKPGAGTTAPSENTDGGNGFSAYKIEAKVILKDGGKILRGVIIAQGPRAIELVVKGKSINIRKDQIVKIIVVQPKTEKKSEEKVKESVFASVHEVKDYVLEKDEEGLFVIISEGEREKVTPKGSGRGSGGFSLGKAKKMMDTLKKLSPADRKKLLEAAKKHLSDTSNRNPKGSIPDSLKGLLKW